MTGINILAEYTAGGLPVVALAVLGAMMIVCLIVALCLAIDDLPGSTRIWNLNHIHNDIEKIRKRYTEDVQERTEVLEEVRADAR